MNRTKAYSQEERENIIRTYQKSGLTPYAYCKRPRVVVSSTTLTRWLNSEEKPTEEADQTSRGSQDLGIVCYTVDAHPAGDRTAEHQHVPLEEMVVFHRLVYECCCSLNQLVCTPENVNIVQYIKEIL